MGVKRVEVYDSDKSITEPIFYMDDPPIDKPLSVDLSGYSGFVNLIVKTIDSNDIVTERPVVSVLVSQKSVAPSDKNKVFYATYSDKRLVETLTVVNPLATANTSSDLRMNLYRNNILLTTIDAVQDRSDPCVFTFNIDYTLDTPFNVTLKSLDIDGCESDSALCTFAIADRDFDFPQSIVIKAAIVIKPIAVISCDDTVDFLDPIYINQAAILDFATAVAFN